MLGLATFQLAFLAEPATSSSDVTERSDTLLICL
jgi:hypothetical protein